MKYKVESIPIFDKQFKRLIKKYPSLKKDVQILVDTLLLNPRQGTPLGNNFYKIRLAIASKNKGKSGGARVITFLKITEYAIYLSSIYDKSEKENLTDSELNELLKYLNE